MNGDGSNKRRKTPPTTNIVDLPEESLQLVSEYLSKPSVAFFAVAVTAPSSAWRKATGDRQRCPSELGKAILTHLESNWEILDFNDVINDRSSSQLQQPQQPQQVQLPEGKADKINDDDLNAVLLCIDAKNKLKRLKLCEGLDITGSGLESLCCSARLEQIDLRVGRRGNISEDIVLPILNSFISTPGSSLRQIEFPMDWISRNDQEHHWQILGPSNEAVEQFMTRYNEYLETKPFNCAGCADSASCRGSGGGDSWVQMDRSDGYGLQFLTCYECLKNFCTQSPTNLRRCAMCHLRYCSVCLPAEDCDCCDSTMCKGCGEIRTCQDCGKHYCQIGAFEGLDECSICDRTYCEDFTSICWCDNIVCDDCGKQSGFTKCDECHGFWCSNYCFHEEVIKGKEPSCSMCLARAAVLRRLQVTRDQLLSEVKMM